MNYFELFQIPVQLRVNAGELKSKFYSLSKQFHPDRVGSDDEKQAEALEISALLNKAWKTFQHTDDTIKYVLTEKGLLEEEEKYDLPPDFLMEILDINDQLMEADEDPEVRANIESAIANLQTEIYEPVQQTVEHYQEGITTEKELLQVKDYYYKKKYLDRIARQLKGMH